MNRRDAILEAATRLFSVKGFKEASMNELAEITGVAQGTIFYHFKNKEGLFISTLERVKETILEQFEKYIKEQKFNNGLEKVEGAISFYLYLAGAIGEEFLLLHRHDAYEFAEINQTCRGHLEAIYDCLLNILEEAMLEGQKDGSIRELNARKTALILFSMVDGLVRLKTFNLYNAGALYNELIFSCRRILENVEVSGEFL